MILVLGMRNRELRGLTARDVDAAGELLWIPGTKTRRARRHLIVPAILRAPLSTWAAQVGDGRLFARSGDTIRDWVEWCCQRAQVPRVTPHGLRGTQSTLARRGGESAEAVARQLGHGDTAIGERHYTDPSATAQAAVDAAARWLS
jgi:integrase